MLSWRHSFKCIVRAGQNAAMSGNTSTSSPSKLLLPLVQPTPMATTSRDTFVLPVEFSRAILAVTEDGDKGTNANGRNAVLKMMALVGHLWRNALAPPAGVCVPALIRRVTLAEQDILAVTEIVRPWWRWVRGRDFTDTGLTNLAAGCSAVTTLDLFSCIEITDAGAGKSSCWMHYHHHFVHTSFTALRSRTQGWRLRVWLLDALPSPLCPSPATRSRTQGWRV